MSTIFTKNLKCKLSREEVEQRAARMADVESDIRSVEEHRKSVVADLNGRKKALDSELATLGRQVREHAEYRDVECSMRPDYEAGIMETVRLDTEERVDVRKLYDSERQEQLPLKEAVAAEPAPVANLLGAVAMANGVVGPMTLPEAGGVLGQIEAQERARREREADAPPLAEPAAG